MNDTSTPVDATRADSTPVESRRDDPEPADRHGARAALYAALAGAFEYPDESVLADLTADETVEGIRTAAGTLGLDEAAADLLAALDDATVPALRRAYDDLFGVPGEDGTYRVVPYEAAYTVRDDVGQRQRRIATVSGLLDAFGLQRHEGFAERWDHVAVELELMQVLAGQHVLALAEGDDARVDAVERAQATVVHGHLVEFVPALSSDLHAATDGDGPGPAVYRHAAALAAALVADDAAAFPEVELPAATGPTAVERKGGEP